MKDTMSDFILYASGAFLALFFVYCVAVFLVLFVQETVYELRRTFNVLAATFKKRRIP